MAVLYTHSLSVLMAHFQVNLGWPVFIEAKDDGGGGDNWTTGAISRAKLQSHHHHQQTNIQFFYRPDALPVAQAHCSLFTLNHNSSIIEHSNYKFRHFYFNAIKARITAGDAGISPALVMHIPSSAFGKAIPARDGVYQWLGH